jgi:hypothetical protein
LLVAWRRTTTARLALAALTSHSLLLWSTRRAHAHRDTTSARSPWPPRPGAERSCRVRLLRDATRSHGSARDRRGTPDGLSTLRNLRPPGGGPSIETEMRSLWTSGIPRVGAAPIVARNPAPSGERPGDRAEPSEASPRPHLLANSRESALRAVICQQLRGRGGAGQARDPDRDRDRSPVPTRWRCPSPAAYDAKGDASV